jgi:hypothetical protein
MKLLKNLWFGFMLTVAATMPSWAATVSATLDPADISLGDSTQLTVTVSDSSEQANLPSIDGLEIQAVSQGTQFSVVNGSISRSNSVTYSITPQRAGTFTIPALQVGDAKSVPITLRVTNGASGMPQASAPANAPGSGPVIMPPNNGAPAPAQAPPSGQYGEIEINVPKKEVYVGEFVPVDIKAYIPGNIQASLGDLPQFTSDGFTLNSLSQRPQQAQQVINGRIYNTVEWHTGLTAIKAGDFPINIKMPITVIVPRPMPQMPDDDPFNNFFRNAMSAMGQGERKNVDLKNEPETLTVLPLPTTNRPADFSGAVGQFAVEATATPNHVNVGDPVTLKLSITGRGNFDRVSTEMLPADSNWKTYSPKTHFDPADDAGYAGTKTFEQPIIASNGSVTSIPAISFSFFDPELHDYQTVKTSPVPLIVDGPPAAAPTSALAANAVAPSTPAGTSPAAVTASGVSDLRMNRIEPGAFVATLRPVYQNPVFLGAQSLPLFALLAGLFVVRRQQSLAHPERRRLSALQQSIRQEVAAMDAALAAHEAGPFFVHARNALQQRYGAMWKITPEAITVADLDSHLGAAAGNSRTVFEMADQATYSDLNFGDADLAQWRQVVMDELAETI